MGSRYDPDFRPGPLLPGRRGTFGAAFPRAGKVELLLGAGITAAAIRELRQRLPMAHSFHMSGKRVLSSKMCYRKQGVSMGLPGMSEFEIWQTEENAVREAWKELDRA